MCCVAWVDWIFCNFFVKPLLILLPWISIVGKPCQKKFNCHLKLILNLIKCILITFSSNSKYLSVSSLNKSLGCIFFSSSFLARASSSSLFFFSFSASLAASASAFAFLSRKIASRPTNLIAVGFPSTSSNLTPLLGRVSSRSLSHKINISVELIERAIERTESRKSDKMFR